MSSGLDIKASDWMVAAHLMLKHTTKGQAGVAFFFGSPTLRVAAQVSMLGSMNASDIPDQRDYSGFDPAAIDNIDSPFSIRDLNGQRGSVLCSSGTMTLFLQSNLFSVDIDISGETLEYIVAGQMVIRKVLNYDSTFTTEVFSG